MQKTEDRYIKLKLELGHINEVIVCIVTGRVGGKSRLIVFQERSKDRLLDKIIHAAVMLFLHFMTVLYGTETCVFNDLETFLPKQPKELKP